MADLDEYLPAIAAGDADAFARWVAGAEARVRLSLSRYAAAVDTEAVVQECLLRIWQVAPRVERDGRGDSLLRLAIRIARNLAVDEIRRHRTTTDAIEPEVLEVLIGRVDPHADPLLRRAIARCRERLPARPREALDARIGAQGGRRDAAIAAELGVKTNTLLQNFTRARKALRECLRRAGVDLSFAQARGGAA